MLNPGKLLGQGLARGSMFSPELTEEQRLIEQNKQALNKTLLGDTQYRNQGAIDSNLGDIDSFGHNITARSNFHDKFQAFNQQLQQYNQPAGMQSMQQLYEPTEQMVGWDMQKPQASQPEVLSGATAGPTGDGLPQALQGDFGDRGSAVVQNAMQYRGIPYKYGGNSASGMDCSAFTMNAARASGENIGRDTGSQIAYFKSQGRLQSSLQGAKPGDMLYFQSGRSPSGRHSGIYLGGGKMIHAGSKGVAVANITLPLIGVGRM